MCVYFYTYKCAFCLSVCCANSREIILPQSPCLSGQSDEGLVIFNTAGGGGGGGVVQVSETLNLNPPLSASVQAHLTLTPSVSLLWVFFLSRWDCSKWLGGDRWSSPADNAHRRNVKINWTGSVMARYKVAEEAMQTQLGLRVDWWECRWEKRWWREAEISSQLL